MRKNHLVLSFIFLVTLVCGSVYAAEVTTINNDTYVNTDLSMVDQPEMSDMTCEELGIVSTLKYGKRNSQVSILQDVLINSGYYSGEPTGVFDTNTKNAVKMMQKAVGVKADGVVGPVTRSAMRELCVSLVIGS
jgi:peptidoglycan hydrolase-like protein with peptidoglycan-binding domain